MAGTILPAGGSQIPGWTGRELLATGHMNWIAHVSTAQVRAIATIEPLAAVGLTAPDLAGA
jgi:hypothetical protein